MESRNHKNGAKLKSQMSKKIKYNNMKNFVLLTIAFLMVTFLISAQTKVITVNNADEFINAIGSDRTIQLSGNTLYLSNVSPSTKGTNYKFEQVNDGYELSIFGVNNLKIVGLGEKPVKILTKPTYGNVVSFSNCTNISIENVDAGHGPEKGVCSGGVFRIINSNNFFINSSIMYGCGTEGIYADNVSNLKCTNSTIRSCSNSIMSLYNCNEIEFNKCTFNDNSNYDQININNCINVKFQSCVIENNQTIYGENAFSDPSLFNVNQSMSVVLKDCVIQNNLAVYFCNKSNAITLENTKLENNEFKKGNFGE